jgi:hypothetical protein
MAVFIVTEFVFFFLFFRWLKKFLTMLKDNLGKENVGFLGF